MKKFQYVEDYIEVINGDRDPVTGKLFGLFDSTPAIISLARYDVSIVDSMSQAVQSGKSLTDKQADLAVKIILKYRKQLTARNVDVSPVENPKFRLGIREIDRRRLAYVDGTDIVLQFPYDTKLIDSIREIGKLSQGRWGFDGNTKSWKLGITEMNVVAAHGFASNNQFEISTEFTQLLKLVEECEATKYSIELISTEFPYIDFLVNASGSKQNNKLYWKHYDDGNYIYQASIPEGNYDSSSLISTISNILNQVPKIDYTVENPIYNIFEVNLDSFTQEISFTAYKKNKLPNSLLVSLVEINNIKYVKLTISHQGNLVEKMDTIEISGAAKIGTIIDSGLINTTHI